MAHTFEIRFGRSTGLLGWLEAPANRFRWKGNGRLSIEGQAVSISVRRGLMNLFTSSRSRHIPAEHLTGVYREGQALRIEFDVPGVPNAALAIWAPDNVAAAEIVRLLPTRQTVELEHNTLPRRYRLDWQVVTTLMVMAALAVVYLVSSSGESGLTGATPGVNQASTPLEPMSASSAPARAETPAVSPPDGTTAEREYRTKSADSRRGLLNDAPATSAASPDAAVGLSSTALLRSPGAAQESAPSVDTYAPGFGRARAAVFSFKDLLVDLRAAYNRLLSTPDARDAADLEQKWWRITERLYTEPESRIPELLPQRELQLAISRAWRNHLFLYAQDLREGRLVPGELAQGQLELAEHLAARL